jgi:hypothetical protein
LTTLRTTLWVALIDQGAAVAGIARNDVVGGPPVSSGRATVPLPVNVTTPSMKSVVASPVELWLAGTARLAGPNTNGVSICQDRHRSCRLRHGRDGMARTRPAGHCCWFAAKVSATRSSSRPTARTLVRGDRCSGRSGCARSSIPALILNAFAGPIPSDCRRLEQRRGRRYVSFPSIC